MSEVADLKRGDIFVGDGMSSLMVRRGKGGEPRAVRFNEAFMSHLIEYLSLWKLSSLAAR